MPEKKRLSPTASIVFPAFTGAKSHPTLAFAAGTGGLLDKSFGILPVYRNIFGILLVECFVVTILDTAARLNLYLFEELRQFIFKNVPNNSRLSSQESQYFILTHNA